MSKFVLLSFLLASLNYFSQNKINDSINCSYRENKSSVCPKCKSEKKVLPIFYGLTTGKFMKKNKNKFYFGGCELTGCDPKWYCKTDQLKF